MKHALPLLLLTGIGAHAQTTLTYGDLSPTGVRTTIYVFASGAPTSAPSDGVNQTWDLTGATFQPVGTMDIIQAAGTPYASTFPNANWVWRTDLTGGGTEYLYLLINSGGIEVVADKVPTSPVVYTDTKKVLEFPMAFGANFSDNYVNNSGPATAAWSYTGHGTVLSALGTFPNISKLVSTEGDMVFWNKTPLFPFIIVGASSTPRIFADATTGIIGMNGGRSVLVYPNPCVDRLMVDGMANAPWRVTDMGGRTVLSGAFITTGTQGLDISGLAGGSYLFVSEASNATHAVRFSKL